MHKFMFCKMSLCIAFQNEAIYCIPKRGYVLLSKQGLFESGHYSDIETLKVLDL